jgi:tetratricopeptide (TPR) repeat protein
MKDQYKEKHFQAAKPGPGRIHVIRRILNLRLLAVTFLVLALVGPTIYLIHQFQIRRTAGDFINKAEALAREDKWAESADYLFRYLELRPKDGEARIRLAETYARAFKDPGNRGRAIDLYYQALGVAPPEREAELRRQLGDLLLESERFAAAESEGRSLRTSNVNDPAAWRILAFSIYGQYQSGVRSALTKTDEPLCLIFERAIQLNPGHVDLTAALAEIYRNHEELLDPDKQKLSQSQRNGLADGLMDQLVAEAPKNPQAFLARYRYRTEFRLPHAEDDLKEALQSGPQDLEVLLAAAAFSRQEAIRLREKKASQNEIRKLMEEARHYYERICAVAPADERGYLGVSQTALALQEPKDAVEILRQGLEKCGDENFLLNAILAETLLEENDLNQADAVIQTLKKARKKLDPAASLESKANIDRTCDLLEGQLHLYRGEIREAIPLLKRVTTGQHITSAEVAQTFHAWMLLGKAFSGWQQWDRAAAAFEKALTLQPQNFSAHVAAMQAWANAGRPDLAIQHCDQSLTLSDVPELWLMSANFRLEQELNLPPEQRNWEPFQQALAAAQDPQRKPPLTAPWRVQILAAKYSLLTAEEQGQKEQKIKETAALLRSLETQYPDSPELLQALIPLYDRMGRYSDVERILNSLDKSSEKPGSESYILRAQLLVKQKQFDRAREVLQTGLQKLSEPDRDPLRAELLRVDMAAGRSDRVTEQLQKWCTEAPMNLEPVRQLAENALQRGDFAQLQQCEQQFMEREGSGSVLARYYQAQRLLAEALQSGSEDFSKAAAAQAYVQNERPDWPPAHTLKGMILQAQGNFSQAADAYQEAIRLGEQRLATYERIIALLIRLDRLEEARQYISFLRNSVTASRLLTGMEVNLTARQGEVEKALQLAEEAAKKHPDDAMVQLWLGQMFLANGQNAEAEKTLREALRLAPQDSRVMLELLNFYVSINQVDKARNVLQGLEADKTSSAEKTRLLAQGYEFIGAEEEAEKYYRLAVQNAPAAEEPQLQLAEFLFRKGDEAGRAEAEKCLRAVLQSNPLAGSARRLLAQILIDRGGEKEWSEAEQLLEAVDAGQTASLQNQRMQILALVRRGGPENFAKAQKMLERLIANPLQVSASDRLLLARLFEFTGKPVEAREQLLRLVRQPHPRPAHLVAYIDLLIRQERLAEAGEWLQKLEQSAPEDFRTASLRARWLHASGRNEEIEPVIEAAAERYIKKQPAITKAEEAQFCQQVGNLYLALEQYLPAERWYRRVLQLFPERYEVLARALARQDRISEAIDLCTAAAATDQSSRPASTLALVLLLGHPTEEDFRRAEPVIKQALGNHQEDVALLSQVANLRVVQDRVVDALALYRQVLRLRPRDVVVMNNMATLLGELSSRRKEALECIEQAISIAGPQPMLLDTKGMILFYDGKWNEAVSILQQAAAVPEADPRYAFHLAAAYQRAGDPDQAREALNRAKKKNLTRMVLTALERKLLDELEGKLGQ